MNYLLWTIFIIGASTLYISLKLPRKKELDKVILVFLLTITVHALYVFLHEMFSLSRYIDIAFPFGLIYGPIFYYAIRAVTGKPSISKLLFKFHMSPFLLGVTAFLVFCFLPEVSAKYSMTYHTVLYSLVSISMFAYVIAALLPNRKLILPTSAHKTTDLIVFGVAIIAVVGVSVVALAWSEVIPGAVVPRQSLRILVYGTVLIVVALVFHYKTKQLRGPLEKQTEQEVLPINEVAAGPEEIKAKKLLYEKSLISDSRLAVYERRLKALEQRKMYRDMGLSLEDLATEIEAPKHHLTQLLNVRMDTTFTKYINGLRVAHACDLLKSDESKISSMEELAYDCGFSSRVSFYRNFKNLTGKTPTQYRKKVLEVSELI